MDSATEVVKTSTSKTEGFFKTVFNFDEDGKAEMMNLLQYLVLAIIPCVVILKTIKYIIPEEDDTKGSLEILAEIIAQLTIMVLMIHFSDRAIRYCPTYSGVNYPTHSSPTLIIMLPFMIVLLTMQTKLGEKVNILFERVMDLWHGRSEDAVRQKESKNNVKVSQPLAGQHHVSRADGLDNMPGLLPNNPGVTTQVPNLTSMPTQQNPDFNLMYQNEVTPMPGAQAPGGQEGFVGGGMMEPMAANAALGGGGFGSW